MAPTTSIFKLLVLVVSVIIPRKRRDETSPSSNKILADNNHLQVCNQVVEHTLHLIDIASSPPYHLPNYTVRKYVFHYSIIFFLSVLIPTTLHTSLFTPHPNTNSALHRNLCSIAQAADPRPGTHARMHITPTYTRTPQSPRERACSLHPTHMKS